ncbi:MAG: hypothetical protein COT88_00575 [Candidatus Colwellbacteria bacterium CG10_big_fil_rev_8_21_14_0_10_41_28]|uniref:Glycosyltransferase family 4 protein n=1 Tax=Candidatus Colwellbacteria bacterium CG10_big_fil_rev_8_21_14_0_10_41_28 TaxID=1974539 RepID=A0A2H0VHM4_9BACT|nr:MAG: hypothetical protein COT88_00575 [Candidatus Colwellbacteria bacterium CG10_big_fil_rev_8_21_14_0_10_41_28]
MRVGIFTNNYIPIISGVATSVTNFRKGLENKGHEVYIFAPEFKEYEEKDERIFRYPSAPFQYKAKYPVPLPSRTDEQFIKEMGIELIHSQHPWGIGRSAMRLSRKHKLPIVFTNHTMYGAYVDYLPPVLPRNWMVSLIEKSAVNYANKADAVIAPSKSIKQYLEHVGVSSPISPVPSGLDFIKLKKSPKIDLRKIYKIPQDNKIIINVSRIGPEKNLPIILKAYKRILEKENKVSLVMVGGGTFLNELKLIASRMGLSEKIIFTGLIDPEEIGGYYREADIFIHASLTETQGLVMAEAMAFGLPVVAVKATGVVDIVEDGVNGYITPETPKALEEKVLGTIYDDQKMKKLSGGALKTAEKYSISSTTDNLIKVYRSVL